MKLKEGTVMLEISHVTKKYRDKEALSDVSLTIPQGQIVGLLGENGAGKTTTFNLLTGVYKPDTGTILLDGQNLTGKSTTDINKAGIARTFQNIRLWKSMTVFENVLVAKHMRAKQNVFSAIFRANAKEEARMREETMELLKEQGLEQYKDEIATSLPYGLQRRLEIARALATDPKLLLLDEPAAGMNPQETQELAEYIKEIRDRHHLTVFLIEHHMDLVMKISDYIYVIDFGSEIARGVPKEVQQNKRVIEAYLGVTEDA